MHRAGEMAYQKTHYPRDPGIPAWMVMAVLTLVPLTGGLATAQEPATSYSVLYNFAQGGSWGPGFGPLVQDAAGNLYGTTIDGGTSSCGVVYELSADGTYIVLHNFTCGYYGEYPYYGVTISGNTLYGTTDSGGPGNAGVVYAVDIPTGTETVLYTFDGSDGREPSSGLVQDQAGNLYGCRFRGGYEKGYGVLYKLDPDTQTQTVLYKFKNSGDGGGPSGNLTLDATGTVLYGTAISGGASGFGVVFSLALETDTYSVLHSFTGGLDGWGPNGFLTVGEGGVLLGATDAGGNNGFSSFGHGYGVVFELFPTTGKETVLHTLSGGPDGGFPEAGVVLSNSSTLVGTTETGGANGMGTIFQVDPTTGTETVLHSFDGTDGANPFSALFQDSEGNFYGTTTYGGLRNLGVIFKLTP